MVSKYSVRNGNNMPLQAPLIPDPFVPYKCPGNRSLNVYCRVEQAALDAYLAPTPSKAAGDVILVYISDFTACDKIPFMDAGLVVPVSYMGRTGGYFLFEYEDEDAAIAAGRDLWGYPKKFGTIDLLEHKSGVRGTVTRKNTAIISLECLFSDEVNFSMPATTPHLNIHVQPGPDGKVLSRRIIERDTSPDFKLMREHKGSASVTLRSLSTDPLAEFEPIEVLGATYVVGDFYATEANGWGRTIGSF
jgi:acetoacetate decarboxylase